MWIHTKKIGVVPLRKRAHNIRERELWKSIVWQSHINKWNSSTGKLKDMCDSPHKEKECDTHPEEENIVQTVYKICDCHK